MDIRSVHSIIVVAILLGGIAVSYGVSSTTIRTNKDKIYINTAAITAMQVTLNEINVQSKVNHAILTRNERQLSILRNLAVD